MERTMAYYGDNYADLPVEIRGVFESMQTGRLYARNQMIYTQGEMADCFYYLKEGQAKIFFSSPDGMEKTLTVVGAGTILGEAAFFDEMPRVSSARALQKSVIIAIDRNRLLSKFRETPGLAMHLLNLQARSIRMLSAQVTDITFLQADCRIARLLLHAKTMRPDGSAAVGLTHEEIGSSIGVSRVTVSKILNGFARKGMIQTAYRSILLRDMDALSELAAFE